MFEKKIQIQNKAGIHCRPSSMIMGAVELYPGHESNRSAEHPISRAFLIFSLSDFSSGTM